jgi:two-component system, OmpR family, phosphate regulon sensor histidine kinase PhoR
LLLMDGLISRVFRMLLWVGLGAVLGRWAAVYTGASTLLVALGVMAGVVTGVSLDAWRGQKLINWLRGSQLGTAPRDTGFWGELAYRMERTLQKRDLAVRQEAERLQQFLSAIEASPNGVLLLDSYDQIEWCNRMAADHFGLDPLRDRQQRVTNLVRSPAFIAYLNAGAFEQPVEFLAPRGRSTLAVLVRPYGDGQRLVLSQDITERERTDAMRRDFVANVSHEIRTPLTVLTGFVETLVNLPLSEAERSRVLVLMQQQTDRIQALVADLLTLAQLEGSPRPATERWVKLEPLLQRALADALALSAGRHSITVQGSGAVEVAASEAELLSAISNLMSNAVRYTPEGGFIGVEWLSRPDGSGLIQVRDSGIGIAREHLPRLTERFYRVDGSRSRDTGGTGLGLSIVKHVMQRHGGEVLIDSEPGKGSAFGLSIPAARVRVSQGAASEQAAVDVAAAP